VNNYKKIVFIIILVFINNSIIAKNYKIKIKLDSTNNNQLIYVRYFSEDVNNLKLSKTIDSFRNEGYFKLKILEKIKIDGKNHKLKIDLSQKFENIYIYDEGSMINFKDQKIKNIEDKRYYQIKINQLEEFLTNSSEEIANKGYPFNKIQLIDIKSYDHVNLYATVNIELNQKRKTDKIIIKGYENFPKAFTKHYLKYSTKDDFNLERIKKKGEDIQKLGFVRQVKEPEVLFKKDSTITYLYLEKIKNNSFDGFIGFATNEESRKLDINGYMDIRLNNSLNYGEQININYKSTNDSDRFLKTNIIAPYIFNSPFALELNLDLTKKDSTYTKDKQSVGISYLINNKHDVSFHISTINSTSSLEVANELIKDYKSNFKKLKYDFKKVNINNKLIPIKFLTSLEYSIGKRKDNSGTKTQNKYFTRIFNNFNLSKSSSIFLNLDAYLLKSSNYYLNEMFLFGGINSIRGFEENSIATNKLFLINSEYRLRLNNNIYINTILDTAYYENKLTNTSNNIYGVGLGLNLNTNSGIFRINYANGFTKGQNIDFKLSKIHVSFSNIF
jgi:outer membrane protein assembly factor BamA